MLTSYLNGEMIVFLQTHENNAIQSAYVSAASVNKHLLHRRMCHLDVDHFNTLIKYNLNEDLVITMEKRTMHLQALPREKTTSDSFFVVLCTMWPWLHSL